MQFGDIDERTGSIRMKLTSDGSREVCVVPKIYTFAVTIGRAGDPFGHADSWCYESLEGALRAWLEWDPTATPEPEGWIRNPTSGRRRPEGDPAREYVAI